MRLRRSYAARSAAIAGLALTLGLNLGAGAYAATADASSVQRIAGHGTWTGSAASQPRAAALTWHKLHLIDGWTSSQGSYHSGDPFYAISGGIVYLSGSLHQVSGSNDIFAFLPSAARPARWMYLTVYTFAGTSGNLSIAPSGAMSAYSTSAANARDYTSLAAVSFPVVTAAKHKLTLRDGWTSAQHFYDTGDPSYAIKGDVVHLSGSLEGGAGPFFAWLPSAARPARVMYRTVYTFAETSGYLAIYPNGEMFAIGGSAQLFTSLAAISFPTAAITKHRLTLVGGWTSAQHIYNTGDPAYAVIGGVVYLYGSVRQPSGTSDLVTVLPPAARPAHNLYITVYTAGGGTGTLRIEPNGDLIAYSIPAAAAQALTSLVAVSYPQRS